MAQTNELDDGWTLLRTAPNAFDNPDELDSRIVYADAIVPGTVAQTVAGRNGSALTPAVDYDDFDWWYICEFDWTIDSIIADLCLDGLASLTDIWLNGQKLLSTDNMFRTWRVDISQRLAKTNVLVIAFRSVNAALAVKRPRPRWKTRLADNQQLRWIRTSLLGRIPAWTPPVKPNGPWRSVRIESSRYGLIRRSRVRTALDGDECLVHVDIDIAMSPPAESLAASLNVRDETFGLPVQPSEDGYRISTTVKLGCLEPWWPHTHGDPSLHAFDIQFDIGGSSDIVLAGHLGFRHVSVDRSNSGVALVVNGRKVFCRGACWTTDDIYSLVGNQTSLANALALMRDAGANMIRIGGTMVYESDEFYSLCDRFGIMVWQDFMFANMEYPTDDEAFARNVTEEISEQIARLSGHPCLTVWCGNSEVEQQAAMYGATRDIWENDLFYQLIPKLLKDASVDSPYFPSSPCEGPLPFHNASGISHFFGVGAYKQRLDKLADADVKFASECLALSHIPCDDTLKEHFRSLSPSTTHPSWKEGVPRDSGAGWDFEDIRDHYFEDFWKFDPAECQYSDNRRYLELSRGVSVQFIEQSFRTWRAPDSACSGGIVWQLKDIRPGAGWGLIDASGRPKAAYYGAKRAWQPLLISLRDRGLDGLFLEIVNEGPEITQAELLVRLLNRYGAEIGTVQDACCVESGQASSVSVDGMFGRFMDLTYSYRFGSPQIASVSATLTAPGLDQPVTSHYFPNGLNLDAIGVSDAGLCVDASATGDRYLVTLTASRQLLFVSLQLPGYDFSDQYFHLVPGETKVVSASPNGSETSRSRGGVTALNLDGRVAISIG
jgi:beta-mannosidase